MLLVFQGRDVPLYLFTTAISSFASSQIYPHHQGRDFELIKVVMLLVCQGRDFPAPRFNKNVAILS